MDMLASMRILKDKESFKQRVRKPTPYKDRKKEVQIIHKEGEMAWQVLSLQQRFPSITQDKLVPISNSDNNKEEYKTIKSKVDEKFGKITDKFEYSVLGAGDLVSVKTFFDVSETITDGVAKEVLKLIEKGNDFGKVKMDKYGKSISSDERISYEIEREEEYPESPNIGESRFRNPPTKEDKERYGWKKVLESSKPGITDTKDWTLVSVKTIDTINIQDGVNLHTDPQDAAPPDYSDYRSRQSNNFIYGFYGDEPVMLVGMIVKWNVGSKTQQQDIEPFIDHSVLNWRKW